jgi:hypothetical protein
MRPINPKEMANVMVHPTTEKTITKYTYIKDDPLLQDVWSKTMYKELCRLTRGYGETKGTDTMRFMELCGIGKVPHDRIVTYACIVVGNRSHKKDPNHIRITVGGIFSRIYPDELTTYTSNLTTPKCIWDNVSSTHGARCMCVDASGIYLATHWSVTNTYEFQSS